MRVGGGVSPAHAAVWREYYRDNNFFNSPEWILKVLSVMSCVAWAALLLGGAACAGAAGAGLAGAGAGVALAAAAAAALLLAAQAARLPARAPAAWLLADIITSTAMGVLLLVTAFLSVVVCELDSIAGYLLLPVGGTCAALALGSAGATYRAVTRRVDAALPAREPRAPPPAELDV